MMDRKQLLPLLAAGALAAVSGAALSRPAHADLAVRGYKRIMHTIRVEGTKEYAGSYRFYAVTMPHRRPVPTASNPNPRYRVTATPLTADGELNAKSFSPAYALRLGAIPTKLEVTGDPAAVFAAESLPEDVLLSDPIARQSTIKDTEPHTALLTRYKVVIKEVAAEKEKPATKKLSLALISNEWSGAARESSAVRIAFLLGIPFISLLGLVGRLRARPDTE
jgi:hypothetical protein